MRLTRSTAQGWHILSNPVEERSVNALRTTLRNLYRRRGEALRYLAAREDLLPRTGCESLPHGDEIFKHRIGKCSHTYSRKEESN